VRLDLDTLDRLNASSATWRGIPAHIRAAMDATPRRIVDPLFGRDHRHHFEAERTALHIVRDREAFLVRSASGPG